MRWALIENGVVSLITNQDDKPTIDGLWVECGDAGPGWIYQDGNFSQPQASNPTEWLIDIGPFFDRFGAAKMGILMSSNATVKAILSDLQVRKWIDLKRADVADGLDSLIALNVQGMTAEVKSAVLNTPVTADENLALRKLYF